MSIYAIVGRETAEAVAVCLRKRETFESPVRIADHGQGGSALEEASRVPSDLLLLDIETGPGLGSAILRYRLSRPHTRVVLLALNKIPGDIEVAGVVQAGVYDVVTDLFDLENVLDQPQAELATAAPWLDPSLVPETSRQEQIQERIVEHRVAVSKRPVLIAVAGVAQGVGTTTVACILASYLARRRNRTVLVEAGEQHSLGIITDMSLDRQPVQWLPNLDVCIEPILRNLVRARQHSYVVADVGAYSCTELVKTDADLTVVVLPQVHRILRAIRCLQEDDVQTSRLSSIRYAMVCNEKAAAKTISSWKEACSKVMFVFESSPERLCLLPLDDEAHAWPPGYRKSNERLDQACIELLTEVLPDAPVKAGWPWCWFRRKKTEGGGRL